MAITLSGQSPTVKRPLLTPDLASQLQEFIPERLQLRSEWKLKYSLEQHGSSINTLYTLSSTDALHNHHHGYFLILKDAKNGVFGCFVNEPIRPSEGRFRGSRECFLWKLEDEKPKVFRYTGENEFMIFNTQYFVSFGGGNGHYGLWVDDSLGKGVTYNCPTYDNEVLSAQGSKFDVIAVEVWQV